MINRSCKPRLLPEGRQHLSQDSSWFRGELLRSISELFSRMALTPVCFQAASLDTSTFLPALRSTGVTPLHRYYGGSDSCPALHAAQVSLLHAPCPLRRSAPNHLALPCRGFARCILCSPADSCTPGSGRLRPSYGDSPNYARPNRVRHPADQRLASGCSPPHLRMTQLPSATGPAASRPGGDFHPADSVPL
jgi:hypothetical protein